LRSSPSLALDKPDDPFFQAGARAIFRRRIVAPMVPKPAIIMAQLAGSGTSELGGVGMS
jgi:hypothetical protein